MAATSVRRPIPAVVFILLLSLLSAIVWYRVLNRSPSSSATGSKSTSHSCAPKAVQTTPTGKATAAKAKPIAWPATAAVHVSVLNGTQRNGLARSVAAQLKARGFKIGAVTNDPTGPVAVTQVRYGATAATAARLLQLYLPGSTLVANSSTTPTVVVSLGASYRSLATNAAVARAKRTGSAVVTC